MAVGEALCHSDMATIQNNFHKSKLHRCPSSFLEFSWPRESNPYAIDFLFFLCNDLYKQIAQIFSNSIVVVFEF